MKTPTWLLGSLSILLTCNLALAQAEIPTAEPVISDDSISAEESMVISDVEPEAEQVSVGGSAPPEAGSFGAQPGSLGYSQQSPTAQPVSHPGQQPDVSSPSAPKVEAPVETEAEETLSRDITQKKRKFPFQKP